MHPRDDDDEHVLVMPFVACKSNGGAYEDNAWVAGFEMGVLNGQLSGDRTPSPDHPGPPATTEWRWIGKDNLAQADLLAMKYGKSLEVGDEWGDLVAIRVVGHVG
ncbi:hypothetical protein K8O93_00735 [Gordonia bronchialis]|uniref:hypothetical protein n=1 Tax=Gordonia bronchialis TaxID=2054 RepID=UPI001CC0001E|nr:hypothetical protein [Gordonia bronchialis]UAK38359.1 hypothetical protein K8O93_00735 [Gordonia bronchialis]